jgi:hypothetical protein
MTVKKTKKEILKEISKEFPKEKEETVNVKPFLEKGRIFSKKIKIKYRFNLYAFIENLFIKNKGIELPDNLNYIRGKYER